MLLKIHVFGGVTLCRWVFPDVSNDPGGFMFKVEQSTKKDQAVWIRVNAEQLSVFHL
jgi:hypothetical protein